MSLFDLCIQHQGSADFFLNGHLAYIFGFAVHTLLQLLSSATGVGKHDRHCVNVLVSIGVFQ